MLTSCLTSSTELDRTWSAQLSIKTDSWFYPKLELLHGLVRLECVKSAGLSAQKSSDNKIVAT